MPRKRIWSSKSQTKTKKKSWLFTERGLGFQTAGSGTRTWDFRVSSPALWPLAHAAQVLICVATRRHTYCSSTNQCLKTLTTEKKNRDSHFKTRSLSGTSNKFRTDPPSSPPSPPPPPHPPTHTHTPSSSAWSHAFHSYLRFLADLIDLVWQGYQGTGQLHDRGQGVGLHFKTGRHQLIPQLETVEGQNHDCHHIFTSVLDRPDTVLGFLNFLTLFYFFIFCLTHYKVG